MPKRNSPKKPIPRGVRASDRLEMIDTALDSCRAIQAISTFLDIAATSGELQPALVAEAGWMIGNWTKRVREALASLRESAAKRSSRRSC